MTLPGTLGHGLPARPVDLDRDVAALKRQVAEMQGMLVRASNAANAWAGRTLGLQDDADAPGLTSSWDVYLLNTIDVPVGFTGAVVNVFCSTGATFSGAGNGIVGAQAAVTGVLGPAISNGLVISSGGGSAPCSATSAYTSVITVTPGGTFNVGMYAYASGTSSMVASSDNVHLSVSVIFTR